MRTIDDITLKELIPQRPPFVMIDRLLSCDMVVTVTELEVREDNVFVAEGRLSAEGLMENMAQTCAARMGYINLSKGDKVKIGVIGAVSGFDIFRTPKVGEKIVTTIEVIEELFQITLAQAVVRCGTEELAQAKMKIALMDIDATN
ncbi:MAG: pseudouridylate synthase [Bacteroidales bacterium]|nr:pseudouridylate synthase [Bacteroidales bacterium]